MKCKKCNGDLTEKQCFCPHCGEPVSWECPQCKTVYKPGDQVCSRCGCKLGEAEIISTKPEAQIVAVKGGDTEEKNTFRFSLRMSKALPRLWKNWTPKRPIKF